MRNKRLFIVTGSSDCSVALWDMRGNRVGEFGQEQHWKLDAIEMAEKLDVQEDEAEDHQQDEGMFKVKPEKLRFRFKFSCKAEYGLKFHSKNIKLQIHNNKGNAVFRDLTFC